MQAIWDLRTGKALSYTIAAQDFVYVVRFLGTSDHLVTAGKLNINLWVVDDALKLQAHPIATGKLQRFISAAVVVEPHIYLATVSGDVLQVGFI